MERYDSPAFVFPSRPRTPAAPEALPWMTGELVDTGDVRRYDGVSYRCRISHATLSGWEPSRTPALWEKRPI